MSSRNLTILSFSRLSAILLLAVLVLLNVAVARMNVRVDMTEEGLHTLTDASKNVLSSLGDPATIKVFWHNVPERGEGARRSIDALLSEMKSAGGGRLSVRWVDLDDEDGKREAEDAGVQEMDFQQRTEGEIRTTKGYASLSIEVGDETETVGNLIGTGPRLEYELISRLHKMTRVEDAVIGLFAPQPAMNPYAFMGAQGQGRFRNLDMFLRNQFGSGFRSRIDLAEPVAEDVKVLVVAGPEDLEPEAVYQLDQFLLRGGRIVLLLDPVHAAPGQQPEGRPSASGLEEWLAHVGITVEPGIVADLASFQRRPQIVQTQLGRMQTQAPYRYWPLLRAEFIDQENPATRGFDYVPLFWPAALVVDEAMQLDAGREATILATTSQWGWTREDLMGLDRAEDEFRGLTEEEAERRATPEIPLIALLDGPFESFWKGRPAPSEEQADEEGDAEGDDPADPEEPADPEGPEEPEGPARLDTGAGRLLVLTDAELASDDTVPLINNGFIGLEGYEFVMNLADWMSGSEELLQVRARSPKARTLDPVKPKHQKLVNWLNLIGVPLLVLFAGIVVFIVRRVRR